MTHTWMLSSGGRRGALVRILRATPTPGDSRVVVVDASALSAAGHLADEFAVVPRITDENFISEVLGHANRSAVDMIVPTLDPELQVYAEAREEIRSKGLDVLVSTPNVTELSWDKWKLFRWLRRHGYPTVETIERADFRPGILTGPVVAKPRSGSSSVGVFICSDSTQLPFDSLGDDYIVQKHADGVEITVDFAVGKDGRFLGAVPRRRLEVRAGEVSKGVTVHLPSVEELVRDVARDLDGAYGVLNLQLFYDADSDAMNIIELNARVGGGYPLTHASGADYFSMLAGGANVKPPKWKNGLIMLRFDDAVFVDNDRDAGEFG